MTAQYTINPEFEKLLTPLSDQEFAELKKLIADEGIREPVILWKEKKQIVDGHNRHRIATELKVKVPTVEKSFKDEAAVREWILRNQLGRRNLTRERIEYYRGVLYNTLKGSGKIEGDAAIKLAKDFGVGEKTIRRDGAAAAGVDVLARVKGALAKKEHLAGKGTLTKDELAVVGKASTPAVAAKVIEKIEASKAEKVQAKVQAKLQPKAEAKPVEAKTMYPVLLVEPAFGANNSATMARPPIETNAVVYMMAPDEYLDEAIELLKKWNLNYDGSFIIKNNDPVEGIWSNVTHSFLLVASTGVVTGPSKLLPSITNGDKMEPHNKIEKIISAYHPNGRRGAIMSASKVPTGWFDASK